MMTLSVQDDVSSALVFFLFYTMMTRTYIQSFISFLHLKERERMNKRERKRETDRERERGRNSGE